MTGLKADSAVPPVLAVLDILISRLATAGEIDHSDYDVFLKKYVQNGLVNYSAVESSDSLLKGQLEHDARRFVNNGDKVRLDTSGNRIYLSSIFKWYASDFKHTDQADWLEKYEKKYRGVMQAVAEYIESGMRDYIISNGPDLEFLDYDWSLNEQITGNEEKSAPK